MKPIRKALASPGRISGQVIVRNVYHRLARSVCDASSRTRRDALEDAEQHQQRDRRERQHLSDGDARHAVDPAAARDVEQIADPHGDHTGASEQQDEREPDDEGRRDDRQYGQRAEQRLHRRARAQCHQREGEPEKRGEQADQCRLGHRVPGHTTTMRAGQTTEAPDGRAEQLGQEFARREGAFIVAHGG